MKITQHIPNAFTAANLLCGLTSIILIFHGNLPAAGLLIFIAAVFDYLDGTAARLLKAYSELGKQLDSLADVVSFGVAPGILVFQMISVNCTSGGNLLERMHIAPWFAMLIPLCSAFRLAKFNIDLRQETNFIGLPTPANALFFASIPMIVGMEGEIFTLIKTGFLTDLLSNTRVLTILAVFFSYLLVSDFRIFSMKFKSLVWKGNEVRYIFLLISLALLILFSLSAIPLIIITYLLLSLFMQRYI
ncbi:MAG: CDP-diacylglycerol--serine O-phosphatidyltransferase [bacterium]